MCATTGAGLQAVVHKTRQAIPHSSCQVLYGRGSVPSCVRASCVPRRHTVTAERHSLEHRAVRTLRMCCYGACWTCAAFVRKAMRETQQTACSKKERGGEGASCSRTRKTPSAHPLAEPLAGSHRTHLQKPLCSLTCRAPCWQPRSPSPPAPPACSPTRKPPSAHSLADLLTGSQLAHARQQGGYGRGRGLQRAGASAGSRGRSCRTHI